MPTAAPPFPEMTVKELASRVGAVPYSRVQPHPPPGQATEEDLQRVRRESGALCELLDGVLVEKAVSDESSVLAIQIAALLQFHVKPRGLGWVLGPDGFVWLFGRHLQAPDVSFARRNQRPGGRTLKKGYAHVPPALAVEVFSPGNTREEIEQKRNDFLAAGTELFWVVYPDRREVEVSTGPQAHRILRDTDTLDGGSVLPDFSVKLAELFDIDLPRASE